MKHVLHVVGARPNFMKVAPVHRALEGRAQQTLVHTGQHYDPQMSTVFFEQLGIAPPDVNLEVGSGTHAVQTATIMMRFEPVLQRIRPDAMLVYGDVNSTVAATLVCAKLGVPVGHVEAGLRSRDRTMPEEINRLVTDALSEWLFTPSEDGNENLAAEGMPASKIHFVGNVMVDTLVRLLPLADTEAARRRLGVTDPFGLVTLHRPSNVDNPEDLRAIIGALVDVAQDLDVLFPVHPRTRARLAEAGLASAPRVRLLDPLGYLEFLALQRAATVVITDSGGIQEETTFLDVPCLTIRENTERPVTITLGTNVLVGRDTELMKRELRRILNGERKHARRPPLWDGHAAERIAAALTG